MVFSENLKSNLNLKSDFGKERQLNTFVNYRKVFSENFEKDMVEEDVESVSFFEVNPAVDQELHDLFIEINKYNFDPVKREQERDKYLSTVGKFRKVVAGLSEEEIEVFKETFETLSRLEKQRILGIKIKEVVSVKADSKKIDLNDWNSKVELLDAQFRKGEISSEVYFKELSDLNEKIVKEVGDDELNKFVKNYEENAIQAYDDLALEKPIVAISDEPVTDKNEVTEAFQNVEQNGMDINFTDGGYATVTIDREFPVEISVYRNAGTKEIVYYVADSYAENGIVRVEANQLMPELDRRHMDAFLSKKIGKKLFEDYESVGKIPDKDLILMAEKLLGPGDKRFYKIVGDDRRIMEALVTMLVTPDEKFPNLYKKIRVLNKFFEVKENLEHTRRKFLKGVIPSVSELVNV